MNKLSHNNLISGLLIVIMCIPLFSIYKYGITGYIERKTERRQRRVDRIDNIIHRL
jgi:hypothetical protein